MITLSNVSAGYPGSDQVILNEINFSLDRGVFGMIEGATGSGKTTLVKLLTCQLELRAGSAVVGSYDFSTLRGSKRAKYLRSIGLVSQDFRLLEDKTIEENIRIAIDILPSKASYDGKAQLERVLERYGLAPHRNLFPRQLSHGERQRVAMARAVVREPLVLIADEPTTQLDKESAETVLGALFAEHTRGMTVLVLTSIGDAYKELAAKTALLQNGTLVPQQGSH